MADKNSSGLSAVFIDRPIGTTLLALALVGGGLLAYFDLPVAPLPRVDMPVISVSSSLAGASPETMASSIATPLERRLGRISGLNEMSSSSALGTCNIVLQFDLERDVDAAARDVQAAINASVGDLPTNLPTLPTYRKVNPADAPIMLLRLRAPKLPLGHLFDLANNVLAQKISQISGVGQVSVGGGQQPAIRVQIDVEKLQSLGLTLAHVRQALLAANAQSPKGRLMNQQQAWIVSVDDQMTHASEYAELVISYSDGRTIRLGDVAHVVADVENNRAAAWVDGERSIIMMVRRQPGANILATIAQVRAILPNLRTGLPTEVELEVVNDRGATIRASVHDVEFTLLLTVVLVFLVVWLFLRDLRATIIPCTAIPLSLLGTFMGMDALGYSIDNLSLMALTIATGFVVDDAIVVTENINRLVEQGVGPLRAAKEGAKQIGFTVISITVSLVAVFLPMLLMGGFLGRLFKEFAVTLSLAVGLSALISLSVTPMMCAQLLRAPQTMATAKKGWADVFLDAFERLFTGLTTAYGRGLAHALRYPWAMAGLTFFSMVASCLLFMAMPKGLVPQQDTGLIIGFTQGPQDVSFTAMRARQSLVNDVVLADPDVAHVLSFCGAGTGGAINNGMLFVVLKDATKRTFSATQVITRLRPKLMKVAGITLFMQAVQDVRMGGRSSRTQYQYSLKSADMSLLRQYTPLMLERLKQLPMLFDVASDMELSGLEAHVLIDRDRAASLGVSMLDIDDVLYSAFGQRQVATLFGERSQYRIVLEAAPLAQRELADIYRLYVPGKDKAVPLREMVEVVPTAVALSVNHQGQSAATTLSFNLREGAALSEATQAIARVEREVGLGTQVSGGFAGTAQAFGDSLGKQPWLIALAIIAVYIVLGVLYESFIHPITILSTLPSAGVGALVALRISASELSIMAFVAIILLIGIVKKNAIMMVDVALERQRHHGLSALTAIYEASLLRFRPIMMTTFAALFGALPMALGHGVGSELRRPLGVAIVGGLIFSQALTLFTTPAIYVLFERLASSSRHQPPRDGMSTSPVGHKHVRF